MIPSKKKTPEEIAALRSQLGINESAINSPKNIPPNHSIPNESPTVQGHSAPIPSDQQPSEPSDFQSPAQEASVSPPSRPFEDTEEPVFRLKAQQATPTSPKVQKIVPSNLNQPQTSQQDSPKKTEKSHLPTHRHDSSQIAALRHRENIALLNSNQPSHAVRLKNQAAHPILLTLAYLSSLTAAASSWQKYQYLIPCSLLALSTLLTLYIYLAKKRSQHHAAIILIIVIFTLILGSSQYPELIPYAP